MATTALRIGIAGCGRAARIHLGRLRSLDGVAVVGCADPDRAAAEALAAQVAADGAIPAFADHRELLAHTAPDVLAIFTPHRAHYRAAMDALQAGCHVFIEKPLSTNAQEAADIVTLARGRGRVIGVGHQYRLCPSLMETRRRLAEEAIGPLRLVAATLAQPWLISHSGPEESWRLDPKVSGGGILCDAGDHLIDALLWTTGRSVLEAFAIQDRLSPGLDVVTAAAVRLAGGVPVTLAITGVSPGPLFELVYHGERMRLRATDGSLVEEEDGVGAGRPVPLPEEPAESIDANFIAAVRGGPPLCCPAEGAIETVRLLESITRSAATGQVVRLA